MLTRPRLALILFLALSIVHTWPLGGGLGSKSLNHNTDAQQWAWTLGWIAHAIAHDPLNLFNGNVFAPETNVLTYSDPVIIPALMGAPARWLGASPVLTFNLVVIAGLTLTAWAGWLVAWTWTGSNRGALVAGALTAFNAHLLTRLAHVPAAHSWGLPLTLYLADRLIEEPRRRDAILLALVIAATAATSLYTLMFAAVIIAAVIVTGLRRWRPVAVLVGAAALGLLVALPVLSPYLAFARTGITRPLSMVADFSAHPSAYLTSLSRLDAGWTHRFYRDDVNVLFAGAAALMLAGVGVASGVRQSTNRRRILTLLVIAGAGIVLSLGPSTGIYRALYAWLPPLRGLRAAARFGYLYLMAVALAAAFGVAWLERRAAGHRMGHVIGVLALVLVTVEAWSGPIRTVPFTRVPPIYDLVANSATPVMLVEVPFYPTNLMFENGEYMLNATGHWQPVMNGYSGYIPASYRRRAEAFWFFPRDWAIDAIVADGATHVMVHLERFTADERADIQQSMQQRHDLRLIASDATGHRLYSVTR